MPSAKQSDGGLQGKRNPAGPQRGGWGREGAWPGLLFAQGWACSSPAFAQPQEVERLLFNPERAETQSPAHLHRGGIGPSAWGWGVGKASLKCFRKGLPAGLFPSCHSVGARPALGQPPAAPQPGFLFPPSSPKPRRQVGMRAKDPSFGFGLRWAQILGPLLAVHDVEPVPSLCSPQNVLILAFPSYKMRTPNNPKGLNQMRSCVWKALQVMTRNSINVAGQHGLVLHL